jgi:hypothetical protein
MIKLLGHLVTEQGVYLFQGQPGGLIIEVVSKDYQSEALIR